ncbi:Cytosolic Fe-S cluster assembly factor nar1 [Hypoxylon texense]
MASLNLSINGPSIKSSYQGVINASAPPSGSSSTYGQWALFYVQAPLANAFQDNGSKESVLKVQSTGSGELEELIEDFSEGRIQFAFLKVKDPNTGLPKYALIAWCGGGVPERTKGYFTSHLNAVSKVLHGYHVQITARSDTDLEPANILQKISDASGAKYTAGGSAPVQAGGAPPPVKSKPVFSTASSSSSSFNPIVAARNASLKKTNDDGWGDDAPQVSRTELEKVESAYKPTKVNMAELTSQKQEPSRFNGSSKQDDRPRDVIGGGYQPVGKIDISAIRAAAREKQDDRPTPVKGAYEPVGKVDIAAIRARAQKPADSEPTPEPTEAPRSLAERSSAFSQAERITELPKPKVAKKFGGASAFTGTKPPTPGGLGFGGPSPAPSATPVGSASRTFADQGGKTPAQIWAEKKAQQGGASSVGRPAASPVAPQTSGGAGWQSGYTGKSWAVQAPSFSRGIPGQKTGETETSQEAPASPSGGIGALRDRFKDAPPMVAPAPSAPKIPSPAEDNERAMPPPPPLATRPSDGAPSGGFALPGMPPRPPPVTDEEEEEPEREPSPVRVAIPVPRGPEPEIEPAHEPPRSLPVRPIEQELPKEEELPVEQESFNPRAAATAVAESQFGHDQVAEAPAASSGGKRAIVQYDYEKGEDNEIELRENEYVTNIDMVDEDWWMGTNAQGETGLFPSNYVEIVDDDAEEPAPVASAAASHAVPPPPPAAEPELEPAAGDDGDTATAQFDYEAAEDNELSFPEGAKITNVEYPDEDWWFGHYKGASGLFPANYVTKDH